MALQNIISSLVSRVMPTAVASGLFVSRCTAQQPDGGKTPYGQPDGNFTNVAGLVNIPAMNAPLAPGTIDATEVKELEDIMSKSFRHLLLDANYPAFYTNGTGGPGGQQEGWRVLVTEIKTGITVAYDLIGAEPDSQSSQTRLRLELATVSA